MKKVLFTATVDSHILQFHLPFLKMFKENGYEVHVATNGNDKIPYCDVKHVVSFERSPFNIKNINAIKQLKAICEKEKFEIIHTHTPMGSVVTRLAARKSRRLFHTRVIYTAHGFHFFKGAPLINWLFYYSVEKFLSKYTDTLITINNEDYELAKNKFSKRCHDIQYVPGVGIDTKKFDIKMSEKEIQQYKEKLGLKKDDFIMIYPAEISNRKRQEWLIKTISDILRKHNNIKLLLPGKDSLNGKCNHLVRKLDIEKQVLFLGFRNDIPKLLRISNLALSSSSQEGLPVNIMEAICVGLPIVATNCRGNRDLIKNNVTGFVIDINDGKGFSNAILKIFKNKEKYQYNSKKELQNYLLDNVIIQMRKIYFKKKRILHLLASKVYSGAENVVCTIIESLNDEYDFAYCSSKGNIEKIINEKKISYYELSNFNVRNLKKVLNIFNPDIIHAHDFRATILASKFYKKYLIVSQLHKNDPKMKNLSIKSIVYFLILRRIYKVIGVSNSILNEYIFKKSLKKKYITLHNFVDEKSIKVKANAYKVDTNYDLFFFGRLSAEKRPLCFIEIVRHLDKNVNKCVMIGDGPLKDECRNLINDYSLNDKIEMIGFKTNPFPYIYASKVGIMPSEFEGFGLAAIEASILGKPVLNSGVGGLSEIFKDNRKFICNSINDYVSKAKYYLTHDSINPIIMDYCNKNEYINTLKDIYK